VYIREGRLLHVTSTDPDELLGRYLVHHHVVTEEQLEQALSQLGRGKKQLGEALIGLGLVDAVDIFTALRNQGRDRIAALCGWKRGNAQLYPGAAPERMLFPLLFSHHRSLYPIMSNLSRCLIANRGEIAVRLINACREIGVETVAVYSDADANAKHVHMADRAAHIGSANPTASYLNTTALLQAAQETHCDCVHPGYGFLSDSPEFAQAVIDAGLTWIGPSPQTIRKMGVKTTARAIMEQANVPLVPGFQSATADDDAFIEAAQTIGYPVMVKAAGGGGGKGIRVVHEPSALLPALQSARREAQNAFGDPRVFLEKYIASARHIEVQIIADTHRNTRHLFERECSAQRRHQKIIEETPSPLLTNAMRAAICSAAVSAAQAVDYVNAGTVEFIATPDGEFYFLEMNTRLQVEHPVTELVTGVDLVHLQFIVAAGEPLPFTQADIHQQGHAIECRVYAEDPRNNFLPAIGAIQTFIPPQSPGVRVDSGIQSGDEITIHYDPMIAKIIVHAPDRNAAIHRIQRALQETVILGTQTNIEFLLALLNDPTFIAGEVDTGYVDANLADLLPAESDEEPPLLALIALALSETQNQPATTANDDSESDRFSPWSRADNFRLGR
jgi:acetyl-CoA carboxylase biotin carboxylase subunit